MSSFKHVWNKFQSTYLKKSLKLVWIKCIYLSVFGTNEGVWRSSAYVLIIRVTIGSCSEAYGILSYYVPYNHPVIYSTDRAGRYKSFRLLCHQEQIKIKPICFNEVWNLFKSNVFRKKSILNLSESNAFAPDKFEKYLVKNIWKTVFETCLNQIHLVKRIWNRSHQTFFRLPDPRKHTLKTAQ